MKFSVANSKDMRAFFFFLTLATLAACNDSTTETSTEIDSSVSQTESTNQPVNPSPVTTNCYMDILKRDSFLLRLTQNGNEVTGQLMFDNFEKDGSRGTVRGIADYDTIKLWYDFQSEAMNSVMEIYLKKDGDRLIRGIGNMDVKGDTSYFTDHSTIRYETGTIFRKVSCDSINRRLNW